METTEILRYKICYNGRRGQFGLTRGLELR